MKKLCDLTELELNIATNIKMLLVRNKISVQALADYLNISYQKASYYARGIVTPPIEVLASIAKFFNVSINDITGIDKLTLKEKEILNKYNNDYNFKKLIDDNL